MSVQLRIRPATMRLAAGDQGVLYASSPEPLGPYPVRMTDCLDEWAQRAPDRVFLSERDLVSKLWKPLTYAEARARARKIAQAILDRSLSPDRPVVILSGNSVEHALLTLGAMYAGVPVAPLAPAYSLVDPTYGLLRNIWDVVTPGLVFAAEGDQFAPAIEAVSKADTEIVTSSGRLGAKVVTAFEDLESQRATSVDQARERVGGATIAKLMFTSGSTGSPKGVINTHQNLCANQAQIRVALPFVGDAPPVLCDWLPWNHTFGGNHNFGIVLYNGGTLYIDDGRPVPGAAFDRTVANLREAAPTFYLNVPRGFELLAGALRNDAALRAQFFSRVQALFCAAASIKTGVGLEIQAMASRARADVIPWITGLGATESSPFAFCTGIASDVTAQRIGVPASGLEVKLVPVNDGDRLNVFEARLRGPNVTPGYWRDDAQTRAAFDSEGFYKLGDAMRFTDDRDPAAGLVFEGRLNENFKISNGTWVRVAPLRKRLLERFRDLAREVIIGAPDRDELVALVFPNVEACRVFAQMSANAQPKQVLQAEAVQAVFAAAVHKLDDQGTGVTTRVTRAALLVEAPSLAAGEVTDKGTFNQRAVLRHRSPVVDALYASPEGTVIVK